MNKTVKIVTIILVILLIILISSVGIFKQNLNKMENIIPDYKLAAELVGNRNYTFVVDTTEDEETVYYDQEGNVVKNVDDNDDKSKYTSEVKIVKANEDEVLTAENYKKSKNIMQKRLDKLGVSEYDIRLNQNDGSIMISIPENNDANKIYNSVGSVGKFEIQDEKTGDVLMTNADIKQADVAYYTQSTGTTVYLQLEFTKDGKEKLKNISNTYVEKEVPAESTDEENEEENNEETNKEISYITIKFDDTTLYTTYFGEEMTSLQIPISKSLTDVETINNFMESTKLIADILNIGELPIKYTVENDNYINTSITEDVKNVAIMIFEIFNIVLVIVLILKNGKNGLYGAITQLGFVALLLLVLRYTNVTIAISGLMMLVMVIVLNFVFLMNLLKNMKKEESFKKAFETTGLRNIYRNVPIIVFSVVFTLINNIQISSIGMIGFWGLVIMIIYNLIITRKLLKVSEE